MLIRPACSLMSLTLTAPYSTATFEGAKYRTTHNISYPAGECGIIDSQRDVGGWPVSRSVVPPVDSDHDGMPDDWEADRKNFTAWRYTMLEGYLNSITQN